MAPGPIGAWLFGSRGAGRSDWLVCARRQGRERRTSQGEREKERGLFVLVWIWRTRGEVCEGCQGIIFGVSFSTFSFHLGFSALEMERFYFEF